jgi:hypothetical protein
MPPDRRCTEYGGRERNREQDRCAAEHHLEPEMIAHEPRDLRFIGAKPREERPLE